MSRGLYHHLDLDLGADPYRNSIGPCRNTEVRPSCQDPEFPGWPRTSDGRVPAGR